LHNKKIQIGLTNQKSDEIGTIIIDQLNTFLESYGSPHRFRTSKRFDNGIYIDWYNVKESNDVFKFRMNNIYTIGHFTYEGGTNSPNSYAKILNKDNYDLDIISWGNYNGVYDNYQPLDDYDIRR
jgi:hypothetical protein